MCLGAAYFPPWSLAIVAAGVVIMIWIGLRAGIVPALIFLAVAVTIAAVLAAHAAKSSPGGCTALSSPASMRMMIPGPERFDRR